MINFKVRFRNKTFLMLFIPALLSFIYTAISLTGIVPKITEDEVANILIMLVELLSMRGIVNDPTTAGMSDSTRALGYDVPYEEETEDE